MTESLNSLPDGWEVKALGEVCGALDKVRGEGIHLNVVASELLSQGLG